jgi:hypothetical protein
MWVNLTGGVGNSKEWIPDNGKYGFASGELDFADPSTIVEFENYSINWSPGAGFTGDDDYYNSMMTFSLSGGAQVVVQTVHSGGTDDGAGVFMLNTADKTITFTDADLLHTFGWSDRTTNWRKDLKILELSDDRLSIAVLRDNSEGPWWLIWNFVSKEFADNYVPDDQPDPVPNIGGDPNDILTKSNSKSWSMSLSSPYDWTDLSGNLLNNFVSADNYTNSGWAAYDEEMIRATHFTFTSTNATGGEYVFSSYDNDDVEGTYTIDANNDITFDKALSAIVSQSDYGWISTTTLATGANNKMRIIKSKSNAMGTITDIWFGNRSTEKAEYQVFHFTLNTGGTAPVDPAAAWKKAFVGKTFKPDIYWFIDWVGPGPDFAGGWTSASTFGEDVTSNAWVYDANVRAVAESASLRFYADGAGLKAEIKQTVFADGITRTETGDVTFFPDNNVIRISIPLINYSGTAASWTGDTNPASTTGDSRDWYFVSHGDSNLSNIATNGFWLGRTNPDNHDETVVFHFVEK